MILEDLVEERKKNYVGNYDVVKKIVYFMMFFNNFLCDFF